MTLKIALFFLLISMTAFSQDTIVTFRGKRLPAEIVDKTGDSVHYKRSDYTEAHDTYAIHKNAVLEIKYGNGTSENFFTEAEKSRSLEELKKHIVGMIDRYCYEEDSNKEKYKATFEGDYLRLGIIVREKVHKGFLFDFGHVYQFHPVSERNKTDAYINIWISFLAKPDRMKWDKQKLIMKVKGHEEAHEINRSLQYLNRLLRDKKTEAKQ